jgi:hypothetical protein
MGYQDDFNKVRHIITYYDYAWGSAGGYRFIGADIRWVSTGGVADYYLFDRYTPSPDAWTWWAGPVMAQHSLESIKLDAYGVPLPKDLTDQPVAEAFYFCLSGIS